MNAIERVRAAMACQPVDRVPLGFYAVDHDTVARVLGRPTYVRNKVEMQIALWEGRRDELAEGLKKDSVEFYRKIDCADLILFKEAPLLPPKDYQPERPKPIGPDRWEDRQGRIWQANRQANDLMCVHDPRPRRLDYKVEEFPPEVKAEPPDDSVFEVFDHLCRELGKERFIAAPMAGLTAMPHLGDFENTMMVMALQPEVVHAANRRSVNRQNQLDAYGARPGSSGAHLEQDLAGTNAPFMSPRMFRELCFPYMKERVAHVRKFRDRVSLHCCGMTIPLIEMFIEAGIDCYQSLQTTAGMEVGKLKKMFGGRMSFWGGVGLEVLIQGDSEDVRKEVRQAMQRGAPGGGFILGPSHSIAANTRYENFMAMLDEFVALRDKF